MPDPIRVEIYSRLGCHLCDEAKEAVQRIRARWHFDLRVIDIDRDLALQSAYSDFIPVVMLNGSEVFRYRVDEAELERKVQQLWNT